MGEVLNLALADKAETKEIFIHPSDSTASSLHLRTDMMPGFHEKMSPVAVQVKRLDDPENLIAGNAKDNEGIFFKIDTEGWELPVLKGGTRSFREMCPR